MRCYHEKVRADAEARDRRYRLYSCPDCYRDVETFYLDIGKKLKIRLTHYFFMSDAIGVPVYRLQADGSFKEEAP